jgi:hypothetical protein
MTGRADIICMLAQIRAAFPDNKTLVTVEI